MAISYDLESDNKVEAHTQVSTITSKGQITIPKYFLVQLGLKPKRKVTLELHGTVMILKPDIVTVRDLNGCLGKKLKAEK